MKVQVDSNHLLPYNLNFRLRRWIAEIYEIQMNEGIKEREMQRFSFIKWVVSACLHGGGGPQEMS